MTKNKLEAVLENTNEIKIKLNSIEKDMSYITERLDKHGKEIYLHGTRITELEKYNQKQDGIKKGIRIAGSLIAVFVISFIFGVAEMGKQVPLIKNMSIENSKKITSITKIITNDK